VGAAAVGSTISVYAVARLLMNLPAGILADRYGRKPLLVWGPAVTALGAAPGPAAPCLCARGRASTCLAVRSAARRDTVATNVWHEWAAPSHSTAYWCCRWLPSVLT